MRRFILTLSLIFSFFNQALYAAPLRASEIPAEGPSGKAVFDARCAVCHGAGALGTDKGPPLVDKVYAPSHHGDFSFNLAVRNGVRSHHWGFGDMPPVRGVEREEVEAIIRYVRGLQKEAGIY